MHQRLHNLVGNPYRAYQVELQFVTQISFHARFCSHTTSTNTKDKLHQKTIKVNSEEQRNIFTWIGSERNEEGS